MNFFGRPKAAAPKRISKDAVLDQIKTLDTEIGTYEKKETHMNKQIQAIRREIKAKMSAKPPQKEAARRLLTKMKGLEKQLHVISGYMTRLEQIKSGLDTADMQASMVSTLTKGADTIAATLKGRDLVEEMADASDKLEEGLDVLDEVGEIMADPAGRLDAGELDDELAEIMNEDNEELDEFEAAPAMPAAEDEFADILGMMG
ncbi:hypothetical protein FNF28_03075 [Cafeteria roenbergensis]|uniref:Charged multivesicular body protein 5 n=1 Tax=Cafeteria roenbergensis TaxID=33653 RepID=A0A5A8DP10_CAFRO|nr:hypothetical protein FNF28_03075 [Cafeteria roenbergensis]